MKVNNLLLSMTENEVKSFCVFYKREVSTDFSSELIRSLASKKLKSTEYKAYYEEFVRKGIYSDKAWRYLMSEIFRSLKRFLAIQELTTNAGYEEWLYLRQVRRKGVTKLFQKESKRITTGIMGSSIPLREKSFLSLLISEEAYEVMALEKREAPLYLLEMNEAINEYFLAKKLQVYCSAESHKSISSFVLDEPLNAEMKRILISSNKILQAYNLALETLRGRVSVEEFIEVVFNLSDQLSVLEKKELYLMAINRCIRLYNKGDQGYLKMVFELYQSGLDQSIFVENGRMSRFTYRNIASSAVGLKEYKWARDFLEDYKDVLPKKQQSDLYNYHTALLAIAEKNYDTAIELLRDNQFSDQLIILDSRRLLIKVYYETDEWDALNYLLDSFWSYLYRHKELGYHRKNYLNMVKYLKKILSIQHREVEIKTKLKSKILKTENVAEKNWLVSLLD